MVKYNGEGLSCTVFQHSDIGVTEFSNQLGLLSGLGQEEGTFIKSPGGNGGFLRIDVFQFAVSNRFAQGGLQMIYRIVEDFADFTYDSAVPCAEFESGIAERTAP